MNCVVDLMRSSIQLMNRPRSSLTGSDEYIWPSAC